MQNGQFGLKTFQALSYEFQGDTLQQDKLLREVAGEIESYLQKNPADLNAVTDLVFTKMKFCSKEDLKMEILKMQESSQTNKDFYDALMESLWSAPE